MKLTFLGSGSFFCGPDNYHSNILLETDSGKKLLIDCGSDCRRSLAEAGYRLSDINAVYISHLHDDHCGGLEFLGYGSYFTPGMTKPELFCHESLLDVIWDKKLAVAMDRMTDKVMTLYDYFTYSHHSRSFYFDGIEFNMVKAIHVVNKSAGHMYSYGLSFKAGGTRIFFTGDMSFKLFHEGFLSNYDKADVIFQDCETINTSDVHPHYEHHLKHMPASFKSKMWLYHTQSSCQPDAVTDGFKGIVKKGQVFTF